VATELKNIGFRVLVVDLDSQANTTIIMRKIYNVPLQTNAGVVDFLRHKTEHHWAKENIDHARDCIIALVSDDTGGKLDLLMASSEVDTRYMCSGWRFGVQSTNLTLMTRKEKKKDWSLQLFFSTFFRFFFSLFPLMTSKYPKRFPFQERLHILT
jgi:hypothetical protein